jgi:hypothetical protein
MRPLSASAFAVEVSAPYDQNLVDRALPNIDFPAVADQAPGGSTRRLARGMDHGRLGERPALHRAGTVRPGRSSGRRRARAAFAATGGWNVRSVLSGERYAYAPQDFDFTGISSAELIESQRECQLRTLEEAFVHQINPDDEFRL